ncbi:spore gernimation protein [Salicibibacter halophilus]|uniref:Spore gernimation protein n=2 Tax=Salicibibacter halophilus TaxID=2502791 RepID=A0A514LLD8_9BACI|nr:spore morphogenesis/germination protein YwcE [Salicibibacter halophilus]QDI92677.1 spore gernimation protein [Salicibibacter halophilus]
MGIFFLYLFIASATPLFLWKEKRKLALASLPLLIAMWVLSGFYVTDSLSSAAHTFFMVLFSFNVLMAHVAAIVLYVKPKWWKRYASD